MILTKENYFSAEANKEFFSASQVKTFTECQYRGLAELHGAYVRSKTQALLVGGFIDAHFSHELDVFKAQNPEIYTRQGDLRAEYKNANEIIARLERDELAMALLSGDTQQIVTGQIGSEPFKGKLDVWLDEEKCHEIARDFPGMAALALESGAIVDMKIVRDFKPLYRDGEGRQNFIEYWHYDWQMAIYQELMRQKLGVRVPCFILGATKESVPDIGLFHVPQELMDASMELLLDVLPTISAVKAGIAVPERCEACECCRETKVLSGATWLDDWA